MFQNFARINSFFEANNQRQHCFGKLVCPISQLATKESSLRHLDIIPTSRLYRLGKMAFHVSIDHVIFLLCLAQAFATNLRNPLQALVGFKFSTDHELSNREQTSAEPKKLGRVGIQTRGRLVRSANAPSVLCDRPH